MNDLRNSLRIRFKLLAFLFFLQANHQALAQAQVDGASIDSFLMAIQENDTNAAAAMLESNTNLALVHENGSKLPLLEAAAAGNVSLVEKLRKFGADINDTGDTRMSGGSAMTALHEAIEYNQPAICQYLLAAGANPNLMAFGFTTPLHLAFSKNRTEMAGWLLDYGAEPFQEKLFSNDQTTPFELAITRGDGTLVPRMLGQVSGQPLGAKSLQKPSHSKRPRRGVITATELLSERGNALLTTAAIRGELEAVQALLKAGITITNNPKGDTAPLLQTFSLAAVDAARSRPAAMGQWREIQARLKADYMPHADPRYVASLRYQEADLAARVKASAPERWQKVLEILIRHGANYDAFAATALDDTNQLTRLLSSDKNLAQSRDYTGQTPLHWAVLTDRLPLASFWIQAGVPLAATNSAGQTALHLAAANGKVEFIKILLAAHSPTDLSDTNGWTPLDAAIQAKQADSIHLLLGEKSTFSHPERGLTMTLHEAAVVGNIAALAALVETETNLEVRNELGLTPLQVAVQNGHLAAAALLVDKGANVNVRDPEGNTLLHQIFLQPRFTVYDRPPTNWLTHLKADPRMTTYAAYLTVGQYEQGPNPVLQGTSFLLACGLDPQATNHAGFTVMQLVTDEKISHGVFFFDDDQAKLFKLLGAAGGKIDQRDADGNTPLHLRGQDTDSDRAASLIAGGADINATNYLGQTPLHKYAAQIWGWDENTPGQSEPFQLLLYHHANVNVQDHEGLTPLHVLAMSETSFRKEATRALLDAGANPNLRDQHGRTAVHLFLSGKWPWSGAAECIPMLVKAGADLSIKDDQGRTPLHYLAVMGDQNPMFFIRDIGNIFIAAKVNLEARDNDGNTPLLLAAKTGTGDVFSWLVKQGANLDATNNLGQTPRFFAGRNQSGFGFREFQSADTDIFQAIRENKTNSISRLLAADAGLVNLPNQQFHQTPLQYAVMFRFTNVVALLEKNGATWDAASAVIAGRADQLQILLRQNPGVVSNTVSGEGLLHIAAGDGDIAIIKMLLAAHANLQAADAWGLSPLGRALIKQQTNAIELLAQTGAKENFFDAIYLDDQKTVTEWLKQNRALAKSKNSTATAVEIAAAAGRTKILQLLLKYGGDVSTGNPLSLAAYHDQAETVKLLIHAGLDANAPDLGGFTPLHWAAVSGATTAAAVLLKSMTSPNVPVTEPADGRQMFIPVMFLRQDLPGATPLHIAVLSSQTNMIALLLKSKADVNALNRSHRTPLDLAMGYYPPLMIGLFQERYQMFNLLEPLGGNFYPRKPIKPNREIQAIAAAMIEAAGGKHSPNYRPMQTRPNSGS